LEGTEKDRGTTAHPASTLDGTRRGRVIRATCGVSGGSLGGGNGCAGNGTLAGGYVSGNLGSGNGGGLRAIRRASYRGTMGSCHRTASIGSSVGGSGKALAGGL